MRVSAVQFSSEKCVINTYVYDQKAECDSCLQILLEITGQGHINYNICVSLSKSKFIAGQNVL